MEAILKPLTNSLGNACAGLSNACASASSFIDTIQPNGYPSVFAPWGIGNSCGWGWGGFGWGGWGLGGWGLGCYPCCSTFVPTLSHSPLILSHHHSPFLGVYSDNNGFDALNANLYSTPTPQVVTTTTTPMPSFGPTATYNIINQENPFAVPIFGASNEALRMMGYNVPVTQTPDFITSLTATQPTFGTSQGAAPTVQPSVAPTSQPSLFGSTQPSQSQPTQSVPFTTVQTQSGLTPEHFLYPERFKPQNQTETRRKADPKKKTHLPCRRFYRWVCRKSII